MCRRRFPYPVAFPIRFRGSPMRFNGLPHRPSPHRFRGSPIRFCRSPQAGHSPIRHTRSPIARPSPHTIHKLQKSGFHFDETSGSSPANPQPTPSSKHPEPALYSGKSNANRFQQITCVTCPANLTPTKSRKSYRPARWGVPSPPACTAMVMHARALSLTCTAMFIPLRVMCTATSTSRHASDETSVRLTQIKRQSNSLKSPGGHGHGVASRRGADVAVGPRVQARLEAGNCEEGFACLFQGRPYSRIRPALAVPYFLPSAVPKAGLPEST